MTRVAVIGGSGFVGSAVVAALAARGVDTVAVAAPRLHTSARTLPALQSELSDSPQVTAAVEALRTHLAGCDAVVNAAGVAQATTGAGDDLFGANALLPAVIARAVEPSQRFVHVSSAAVQGRRPVLDESDEREPFSPYSASKALGEEAVRALAPSAVVYRPTSVQGAGRQVTASLTKVLRSPIASVAAGDNPTPQVVVDNVGDAAAFLALSDEQPPPVVLHPWEGLTTRDLYRVFDGRRPVVLPRWLARLLVGVGHLVGRFSGAVAGVVRRVEMLWFGQAQSGSWLEGRWQPPLSWEAWRIQDTSRTEEE